ncbi:MAG: nickel-dependent lactate racemase [Thermodesulfobacteriota bacterium]
MPKTRSKSGKGQSIRLRVSLWNDEREIRLNLPEEWDVVECRMAGHNFPPLSDSQIREAFENPIGTPRIRDLAKGKEKVVILFDDLARPTPVYKVIPYVLKELEKGGVRDDQIRLVCAIGCHRALIREELVKKLGRGIVENYPIYNHNLYEHHVRMGTTSRGTPVWVNREVAGCDLKIGLGGIIPHFTAGFGGGAKILLPGVSSIDTVAHNHLEFQKKHPDKIGLCKVKDNPVRLDMEEAARIAGLDFVADVVINHQKEILGIFMGDVVESHRQGIAFAKKVCSTENQGRFDLILVNTFPIEEAPKKALWPIKEALNEGGDVVLIWQSAVGWHPHFLVNSFGSDYGGRKWDDPSRFKLPVAKRLFIYAESLSKIEQNWFGSEGKVFWYRDWGKLMDTLKSDHGKGTRLAVYPYATMQCPMTPDEY